MATAEEEQQPTANAAVRQTSQRLVRPSMRRAESEAALESMPVSGAKEKVAGKKQYYRLDDDNVTRRLGEILRESTPKGVPYFMAGLVAAQHAELANIVACACARPVVEQRNNNSPSNT